MKVPVRYSPQFKNRRLNGYDPDLCTKIKEGDWVLVCPDSYTYHVVEILCIYTEHYLTRISVRKSSGISWTSSIEEIFAKALPSEIDTRLLPNLGYINKLFIPDEPTPLKQFIQDFNTFNKIYKSLSEHKLIPALNGLKMEYLSMPVEDQLTTAHLWSKLNVNKHKIST